MNRLSSIKTEVDALIENAKNSNQSPLRKALLARRGVLTVYLGRVCGSLTAAEQTDLREYLNDRLANIPNEMK